jgi:hypothetical protein
MERIENLRQIDSFLEEPTRIVEVPQVMMSTTTTKDIYEQKRPVGGLMV